MARGRVGLRQTLSNIGQEAFQSHAAVPVVVVAHVPAEVFAAVRRQTTTLDLSGTGDKVAFTVPKTKLWKVISIRRLGTSGTARLGVNVIGGTIGFYLTLAGTAEEVYKDPFWLHPDDAVMMRASTNVSDTAIDIYILYEEYDRAYLPPT